MTLVRAHIYKSTNLAKVFLQDLSFLQIKKKDDDDIRSKYFVSPNPFFLS